MSHRRQLSWATALRDLNQDRATRPEVREERLRTTAGLRGSPALALSAWRGKSGKRYVVGVHSPGASTLEDLGEAVVLAVRRPDVGAAVLLDVIDASGVDAAWTADVCERGANELHIHRLAEDKDARAAIVADLPPHVTPAEAA